MVRPQLAWIVASVVGLCLCTRFHRLFGLIHVHLLCLLVIIRGNCSSFSALWPFEATCLLDHGIPLVLSGNKETAKLQFLRSTGSRRLNVFIRSGILFAILIIAAVLVRFLSPAAFAFVKLSRGRFSRRNSS